MPNRLKVKRLTRVALVDAGANPRADVLLFKTAGSVSKELPAGPLSAHLKNQHGIDPAPPAGDAPQAHIKAHQAGQFADGTAEHQHPYMSATAKSGRKVSDARLATLRAARAALQEVILEGESERTGEEPPSAADLGKRADAAIKTAAEALALLGQRPGDPSGTMREIESLAKSRRDADPSKTVEQAMADTLLTPEGSQLYAEYVVAQREQADALAKSRTPDAPAPPATNVEKSNVQKMAHLIDAEVEKLAKAAPSMSRSDLLAAFYSTPEGKEAYTLYDRARRQAAR